MVGRTLAKRGLAQESGEMPRDLRGSGLSSLDFVNLMLALEADFDLEFNQTDMTLDNFQSLDTIETLVLFALAKR